MIRIVMAMGVATIALAGMAWAHPHAEPEKARDGGQVKKVVIYHRDGTTREIDVDAMRDRAIAKAARCGDAGAEGCGVDKARLAAALEEARARIASETALDEAHRARAIAALERRIARLKAESVTP